MLRAILAALFAALLCYSHAEARRPAQERIPTSTLSASPRPFDASPSLDGRYTLAATNTTVLASYSFDAGASCSEQGWTKVDATTITTLFWHVDDFAGVNVNPGDVYAPLADSKSLWCGARAALTGETCGYASLPGYGNGWNQAWQTKNCISVTGNLDVSFLMQIDTEADYDYVSLEYTSDCNASYDDWILLDGKYDWDGIQTISHSESYAVGSGPVRVRLRFFSDGSYSDQDNNYDSHAGAVVVDNLFVEGTVEDFEDEAVGETSSDDWEALSSPGAGQYFALFRGTMLLQEDPCAKNLSCMWAAISGSTDNYACGGFPQQIVVPFGKGDGQYIDNEIWSPWIALSGAGSRVNLAFSVYRDLPLDNQVFYVWSVRSLVDGCAGNWKDRNFLYFGDQKDWIDDVYSVGDLLDLANASHIQVRLGAVDMCGFHCGIYSSGDCHSHAPLLDNVRVYRVEIAGPEWSTRDFDMFQDTFPADGTDTGIGRADAARSITPFASPTILPGDSVTFLVRDPITTVLPGNPSGLATDNLGGANGDKACYLWVHVTDNGVPSPTKTGAMLSGGPLYPFKDTQVANGKTWTRIQCWLRAVGSSIFAVDLNDNLFEAGDVIEFFFSAMNTNGETSYCSGSALNYVQSDLELAAEAASEFSVLPVLGNLTEGRDYLYVDGMDGRGGQEFWDTAFQYNHFFPDRYDIRGPSSNVSNTPASRVTDVSQQLISNYKRFIWDCGDLPSGPGDGTTALGKADDYALMNNFLGGANKGVYICGDDAPSRLLAATGASAITTRTTYIRYTLTTGDHRPSFGVAPTGVGVPGSAFAGQTIVIHGGCPLLNDFDVMTPIGTSLAQMTYGDATGTNAAVVSKVTGDDRFCLSGFSFIYIRDDEADGTLDRQQHLRGITCILGDCEGFPTSTTTVMANRLEQNYPNPFNPQTTIAFSLKAQSRVRIDVFDVAGAHVTTLLDETRAAGSYADVRWDGTNKARQPVASGLYFCRLVTDRFSQTRKMALLK